MEARRVVEVAESLHEEYGSEIEGDGDPGWVLIRTIISQNTNERNTRRGFERLRGRFPSIREIGKAPVKEIAEALKPAGLYNQKARSVKTAAAWIVERGDLGDVLRDPDEARETLLELPGVGPKTADVTLAFSAKQPIVPVDTHVDRVTKRLGVARRGAGYDEVKEAWGSVVPERLMPHLHLDLILHGREVCSARKPLCGDCPVNDLCGWDRKAEYGYG